MSVDLTTKIKHLEFRNPITVASGTFGTTDEMAAYVDYSKLGAVISKTVTCNARPGNPMPRICETSSGMINAIGLQNKGVDEFIENKVSKFKGIPTPFIVSIAAESTAEFEEMTKKLDAVKDAFSMIEVNLSCPNVEAGGAGHMKKTERILDVIKAVRSQTDVLLMAKLSPELGDVMDIAEKSLKVGADGLSLINTLRGMAVDIFKMKSRICRDTGGLSGPAIKPVALRYVFEAKKNFDVPVIASGGIQNYKDALEFLIVGADLLALGTSNFVQPNATMQVLEDLKKHCKEHGIDHIDQLRRTYEPCLI